MPWWELQQKKPPQVRPCRLCGENIFYHTTSTGKKMPLDATPIHPVPKPVIVGDVVHMAYVLEPHFASCKVYKKNKKNRR